MFLDASAIVATLVEESDAEMGPAALSAFDRYGRGWHPAVLNVGDCFTYACARQLDLPLLFKGEAFPLTDNTIA